MGGILNFDSFSDKEWVARLIMNDPEVIVSFFYKKHLSLLAHNVRKVFPYWVDIKEYVNEFFLYLRENDWKRLKTYQPELNLTTWISVVSYRFFKNYKLSVIDLRGVITITDKWDLQTEEWVQQSDKWLKKDIMNAIAQIKNDRDRQIADLLLLKDKAAEEVAPLFGVTVDYLYTIKNRIIKALRISLKEYQQ